MQGALGLIGGYSHNNSIGFYDRYCPSINRVFRYIIKKKRERWVPLAEEDF